jgi:hypothetical protein
VHSVSRHPIERAAISLLFGPTEFFNAFNHAQFNNPDAGAADVNFGVISSANAPRLIQVSGRLIW